MELRYRKGPLRFSEVWFNKVFINRDLQDRYGDVDIIVFHESHTPISHRSTPFRNGVVSLEPNLDQLFMNFNSGFRNEVRRAKKEGIETSFCRPVDSIDSIYKSYVRFCQSKHIPVQSHVLLQHYASAGHLFVSEAKVKSVTVQIHIYMVNSEETILLASFPPSVEMPGKIIGWANRALHWEDITQFKEAGLLRYNLGGIGNPLTNHNNAIVAFKNEMCPTEGIYYQDVVAVSQLGKLYLWTKKLIK